MRDRIERSVRMLAAVALAISAPAISLLCVPAIAQTHKVTKQQDVVRAIGVYEWTGDMAKPAASRLIPVSLFIGGKIEDAAIYLAQPVPFALLTGNVYEIQNSGVALGTLDLQFSRHLVAPETATAAYDDGWFGYGRFVPPAPPRKSTLKPVKTLAAINEVDDDDSRPHFSSRSATPGSGGTASSKPGAETPSDTPPDDPDRPTLHRSASTGDQTANSGSTPADDPDRPTLRRRSPVDGSQAKSDQPGAAGASEALNNDPNRPLLHRGKPEGAPADTDLPNLAGLPGDTDLHQTVAVSDAADRPTHDFSRAWEDDNEHQAILTKMQAVARTQLTAYETANGVAPAAPPPPPSAAKTGTKSRRGVITPPPPPEPLLDEQLKGYTLSYGGAATFVYFAHTDGLGPALRYITLVAQVDMKGEPEIAMKNVTDAAHLDRTPRMRLIDAVDAEASNRASLLFELRAQNSRQFALYQVIGARASQTFVTGSTQ
jgi:hypothetical protein